MRKTLIILIVSLFIMNASAQESFNECFKNNLVRMDSLYKIGESFSWEEWKTCVIDKPMPNFTATSISGDTIEMSRLNGKVVVINFWFIDCHPCIAELPGLNKLVDEYKKKDIVFLAITWETVKRLQSEFTPKFKLDFTIIPIAREIINGLIASGYPTTYIIDQQGIIKTAWNGGRTDDKAGHEYYEKAKPVIDGLLKAQ